MEHLQQSHYFTVGAPITCNNVAPFPPSRCYCFPFPNLTALVVLACKNEQSIKTVAMLFSPADHAGSPSRPRIRQNSPGSLLPALLPVSFAVASHSADSQDGPKISCHP